MWLLKIVVFGLAFCFVHSSWKGHEGSRGFQKKLLSPDKESGLIFLHGLGVSLTAICRAMSGPALGLSVRKNKISCPEAPIQHNDMVTTIFPGMTGARSWFNFWNLPGISVRYSNPSESKDDLEEALVWVEEEIKKMIQEGIPSENIVLVGVSQGGALTLYTALHTQYKLGGFIAIITWLPLLKLEPPDSLPTPVNKDTPILHMNGNLDVLVPPAVGRACATAMQQVFTNYQQKNVKGNHKTIAIKPLNLTVYCWLKKNVPNMAYSTLSHLKSLPFC